MITVRRPRKARSARPAASSTHRVPWWRRLWKSIVAIVTTAIVTVVVGLVTGILDSSLSALEDKIDGDDPLPFTGVLDINSRAYDHCISYIIDRPPTKTPLPGENLQEWANGLSGVSVGRTSLRLTLQGSSGAAVVLHSAEVVVVKKKAPLSRGYIYRTGDGCGGMQSPRYMAVDLDRQHPVVEPVPGRDDTGRVIPATSFPFRISDQDPEVFRITANAATIYVEWYLEIAWSSGSRSGTYRIGDEGNPFRTSSDDQILRDRTYFVGEKKWRRA